MSRPGIRVVVADDDEAVREALSDLIRSQPDLRLAGTAGDHADLVTLVARSRPDVVLMDIRMPGGVAATTIGQIKALAPAVAVLALSAFDERDVILGTLAVGSSGYLLKGSSDEEILEAIHRSHRGQLSISVALAGQCVRSLLHNLEEARRLEAGLRRSENTLHDLLDQAPAGVVLVGPSDRVRLANAQAERMFARPKDGLVAQPASMLFVERCQAAFLTLLSQATDESGDMPSGVTKVLTAQRDDGSEFTAVVEMRSLQHGSDQLVGVFIRDLGESREIEKGYEGLLEASPDALVIVDKAQRIEVVNAQTEHLFGFNRDELLSEPLEVLIPGSSFESYVPATTEDREGSDRPPGERSINVVAHRKDGSEFAAEVNVNPLNTERGTFVVTVRDMSEQLRYELVLEQSFQFLRDIDRDHQLLLTHLVRAQEDERRRISVGIHDDTLQAITAASLRVQQLRRRLNDERDLEVLQKLEDTIQLSISRLRHLLFDLRPPESEDGGLAGALNIYLDKLRNNGAIEFHVESHLTSELPPDSQVVAYRIAQEALTNVWKHADATAVDVRLVEVDDGCLVLIEDNGRGYDPLEAEGKPGHLGLTLMQERAQIAGGWCRIESTPGTGTMVQFWIPRRIESAQLESARPQVGGALS